MHDALGIDRSGYFRLFTEKRVRGARTKYWITRWMSLSTQSIVNYILNNPEFTVNGRTYSVSAGVSLEGDFAIYCDAINN